MIILLAITGILLGFQDAVKARQQKPNVLFISVDDLRANLGAYNDPVAVTPNIDRLAAESVVFTKHYVQQPSCAPSRTSMLTGMRPDEVEVTNHNTHFRETRPEVVTLPQLFKNNGYHTVGIGKIFHFRHGFQDAVSWTSEVYASNRGIKKNDYVLPDNRHGGKAAATEKADVVDEAYPDGKYSDVAIDYLRKFELSEEPFFMAVGYQKPHLPFAAPAKYWDLYDRDDFYPVARPERPDGAPEIAFHDDNELRGYTDIPDEGPIPVEKKKELRHGYYATVSYIDAQVGKLLETLDELGFLENTIIVLWGDHGFHLGEQRIWGKSTTYELDAHSPMMISVPDLKQPGSVTGAIVESLDLYPTITDLAGLEPQSELSGKSLRPLLENPATQWSEFAFTQFPRPYRAAIGGRVPMTHMGYSVRVPEWRFTAWYNTETGNVDYTELYAMESKSGYIARESNIESENLSGRPEYSSVESRMLEMVKNYLRKSYDQLQ